MYARTSASIAVLGLLLGTAVLGRSTSPSPCPSPSNSGSEPTATLGCGCENLVPAAVSSSGARAAFERIAALVGTWRSAAEPDGDVVSDFRLTAGGTAVVEREFPGSDHEMMTVYTLDGDELVLTHYCVLDNQPHLRAVVGEGTNRIEFQFVRAGNLRDPKAAHMHDAVYEFLGPDHYRTTWNLHRDGAFAEAHSFDLVRSPTPAGH